MILSENALYIKYIRLKEAGDLPHEYPYTVPALAGFSGLRFRRPVTFIVGENGMGKSTLLEAIAVKRDSMPRAGRRTFGSQRARLIPRYTGTSCSDAG